MGNQGSKRGLKDGSGGRGDSGSGGGGVGGGGSSGGGGGGGGSVSSLDLGTLSSSKVSIEDFKLLTVVGKGSFGKVFLAQKLTGLDRGAVYAIKTLKKDVLHARGQLQHTRAEREILQAMHHPFIVSLKCAFQTPEKLYLVTDFCSGGELFFWLKRDKVFTQSRAKLYAAELVMALEHLHSKDIVYRDLKPENILLDAQGHVKLTDFGLSKMHVSGSGPEEGTMTFCGTPEYLAPEVLQNQGHGKAVDWWSLGTLLFEMMAGLPPFYDTNTEVMYERILSQELRFPKHFLPETKSLLTGMLTRKVECRLGYKGAAEIMAHPFFAGLNWEEVYARRIKPVFVPPHNGPQSEKLGAPGGGMAGASSAGGGGGGAGGGGGGGGGVLVSNFEEEFTGEPAVDSQSEGGPLSSQAAEQTAQAFEGFTYVGEESALAGGGRGGERSLSFAGDRLRGTRGESFAAGAVEEEEEEG